MPALRILLALTLALGLAGQDVPAVRDEPADPDTPVVQDVPATLSERLQKEALAAAETATAGAAGSRSFRVLRPPLVPQVRPGQVNLELSHLSKQDGIGPFFVVFKLLLDGHPAGFARVDLEGRWSGKLLKAKGAMPRLTVPTAEQLDEADFTGTPPPGALQSFPAGFRLKIPVPAGHVLTHLDIQPIPIIKAGDQVRVELVCGPLSVSLEAIARSNAAVGEKVRLELPNGKKPMTAIATAPGEARVDWKG